LPDLCWFANWDEGAAGRMPSPDLDCQTVPEAGFAGKKNGLLLTLAEGNGFDVPDEIKSPRRSSRFHARLHRGGSERTTGARRPDNLEMNLRYHRMHGSDRFKTAIFDGVVPGSLHGST
jgi:hypothetical protein